MAAITLLMLAGAAQLAGEIEYPVGALGYDALVAANYAAAEQQLNSNTASEFDDPARLINLGQVYANTGRARAAEKLFKRALEADYIMIILADGREVSSQSAARKALSALKVAQISSR